MMQNKINSRRGGYQSSGLMAGISLIGAGVINVFHGKKILFRPFFHPIGYGKNGLGQVMMDPYVVYRQRY